MGYYFTQLGRIWEGMFISTGLHAVFSVGGIFFFGFPVVFSFSAYVFVLLQKAGIMFFPSVIFTLFASAILGFFYALLYRRMSHDSFTVFSFASVLAYDALIRSWDSLTGGVLGISGIVRPSFLSSLFEIAIWGGIISVIILVAHTIMLRSSFGRALQGHKEGRTFLDAIGISSRRVGSIVIIVSSIITAVGAILGALRIQFLDPSFSGIPVLLSGLTIVILASKPKVRWLIVSVLFVVLLPEFLRIFSFSSTIFGHLRMLIYSILLIVLVREFSSRYTAEKRFV